MRGLFWVLALFSVAVGLSLVARYDDGYVLIFIAPKRIEFSLTLFVLLLAVAFAMLYFFVRAAAYTLRLPDTVREFRATRVREKARHARIASEYYRELRESRKDVKKSQAQSKKAK